MNLGDKILLRMKRSSKGKVFSRADFLDLGSTDAVGMAMQRLENADILRRVSRGLYDLPQKHPKLGILHALPEEILAAIARRDGTEFQEHESYAANRMRLTEQVPARLIYLTPGRGRTIKAGSVTIELRHRSARKLTAPAPMSAMVFSALRNIGKANITAERIGHLQGLLTRQDRKKVLADLPKAPAWMHPHLRHVAGTELAQ